MSFQIVRLKGTESFLSAEVVGHIIFRSDFKPPQMDTGMNMIRAESRLHYCVWIYRVPFSDSDNNFLVFIKEWGGCNCSGGVWLGRVTQVKLSGGTLEGRGKALVAALFRDTEFQVVKMALESLLPGSHFQWKK